jgi:DNA-directed RNA polymerase specialized sigma24 family protein
VGFDGQALAEFDAAYPLLLSAADYAISRFFRYDPSLIDEAVTETMTRTYDHWEQVRRHFDAIGWLAGCAKGVCLEQLCANVERQDASTPGTEADNVSVTVFRTLDRLPKQQRDVAVLRYMMDCDEATTAAAMGTTVEKVKSAASDARRRLGMQVLDVYRDAHEATR